MKNRSPLAGKRIVLTRSASAGPEWKKYFKKLGAIVVNVPTIETVPVPVTARIRRVFRMIGEYDLLIFTSGGGAFSAKEIMKRLKIRPRAMPPIAAVGEKTAESVRNMGWRAAFVPSRFNSRTLAKEIKIAPGMEVLVLRANIAPKEFPEALRARGARVTDLAVYKTKMIRRPAPQFSKLVRTGRIDYLTFASPSAVRGFALRVKGAAMKAARNLPAIALGPSVRDALMLAKFNDVRVARKPTISDMAKEIF